MIHEAVDDVVAGALSCYIAEVSGAVVGVVVFVPVGERRLGGIVSMGVSGPWRRRGIGWELEQRAMAAMVAAGARAVESEVRRRNIEMNGLNTKLGIASRLDPDDGEYLLYAARIAATSNDPPPKGDSG